MISWLILGVIFIPWLGGLCVWLVGDRTPRVQHILAAGFSIISGLAALALLPFATDSVTISVSMGGVFGDFTLIPDGLGVFITIIATVVGSLSVIFSADYMRAEAQLGRYYALVLLFIGAMSGLALSGSILFMFLFWEITAFCSYALISFHNDDPKAVAGGIKALIVTQIGGVGLLAGALTSYVFFGNYQISTLLANAQTLPAGVLNLIAFGFLAAAAAKSAQVPFQTWLPDAMEAPTPVTALIHAATMVNAGVYLLARFYPAYSSVPGWSVTVIAVGLFSALLAGVMALVANDLKRVLAYSTISQLGYMIYSVGTGAIFASQFHLLSHSVFKALLFLSAGAIITAVGTRDMRLMGGLGRQMPFVRMVFAIGGFALAGLPIANGFFSKELILEYGMAHGPMWAYVCMLIGVGITALYTMRMVWFVFYGQARGVKPAHDAYPLMRVSLVALAFGALTTWLLAGGFNHLLVWSLPFHSIQSSKTSDILAEIIHAPGTWVTLLVVLLGLATWQLRERLKGLTALLKPLAGFAERRFGFEWFNQRIISLTQSIASALQVTQTGQLSWNMVGILAGLIVILGILARGT